MEQVLLERQRTDLGVRVRKENAVGKARRDNEGVACGKQHGRVGLHMLDPSPLHIADLEELMGVGLLADLAAADAVDMIFVACRQIEIIQRQIPHAVTSFFLQFTTPPLGCKSPKPT